MNTNFNKYLLVIAACVIAIGAFGMPAHAQYYGTPTYNYGNYYGGQYTGPLQVSCYSMPLTARVGQTVTWYASAYGGSNNSYYYTWTGDEGLNAYGQTVTKTYNYAGYKNASVTVISGGQSVSKNCSSAVNIGGTAYSNPPVYTNPPVYSTPVYYPPVYNQTTYYIPLSVTCSANATYVGQGTSVTWTAYPSGGNGNYTYNWSGTDNLYGGGQSTFLTYSYPGQKTATVTIYSNGQSSTQTCSNTVTVGNNYNYSNYNYYPNYNNGTYQVYPVNYSQNYPQYNTYTSTQTYPLNYSTANYNGLDIGCYVDPTNAKVGQPITWTAEVTGGLQPYAYSWTGSDGLSGSASSVIKYYSTTGSKSAIVTVTSADGKTVTHACSNNLMVAATNVYRAPAVAVKTAPVKPVQAVYVQPPATQTPVTLTPATNNGVGESSLFSLSNVPWGWVAILVILVLFFTVIYLLFNKQKI